jgi:hypothetical protein
MEPPNRLLNWKSHTMKEPEGKKTSRIKMHFKSISRELVTAKKESAHDKTTINKSTTGFTHRNGEYPHKDEKRAPQRSLSTL